MSKSFDENLMKTQYRTNNTEKTSTNEGNLQLDKPNTTIVEMIYLYRLGCLYTTIPAKNIKLDN